MEKQNYGVIFGDINLVSEEHLQAILDTLNRDTAQYFIIKSVLIAYQKSRINDTVLRSPGCPSTDMFDNFEERGDYFREIINKFR